MPHKRLLRPISLAGAIIIWESIAVLINNPIFLPRFTEVIQTFYSVVVSGDLLRDLFESLMHFGVGLGLGIIIAIPIGIAMGWSRTADNMIDPLVELVRPIPPIAWIPFAIIWLHLTHYAAGFIVFIGAVFPILINTYAGFKDTPRILIESARVLGCRTNRDLVKKVALPYALPSIATGVRIAMGVGWMCVVAAELFGVSNHGLGYKIWWYKDIHQMDGVLTYMLILGLVSLTIDRIFRQIIDEKLLKWKTGLVRSK
ncbi:sulfonate ABC transporter permease [Methanosarcinales archaeon ex4484_138]|nr:MAG: sulfonate ABC transporter permease [Methanosarcinales archaeon ex4484_138]RLG23628.1 MAG: ABC transporter permease [Methanosarcinales archaeon]